MQKLSVEWFLIFTNSRLNGKLFKEKTQQKLEFLLSSIRCCVCVRDENLLFLLFLLLGKISSVEQIFMSSLVFHTFPFIHFLTPLFLLPEKFSLLSGKPRRASCCLVSCILSCYVNRWRQVELNCSWKISFSLIFPFFISLHMYLKDDKGESRFFSLWKWKMLWKWMKELL